MIDYIKYTIDSNVYYLTNNGDGSWGKDLSAPSVAGMYNLLLEIGQDGIKTYIDSTDPRYSFYLEVIEEIEKSVDLIKYLPNVMQEILEFNVVFNAEDIELDIIYNNINKIMLDSFIRTSSIEKITRIENFLKIKGQGNLEQRRIYLLALFQKGKKLNESLIKGVTNTITGSDCIVTFFGADEFNNPQPSFALLQVQVLSPDNSRDYRYADILRTLKLLLPGNIKLLVVKYFATWTDITNAYSSWGNIKSAPDWNTISSYIPPMDGM